jgi:hypothetical protein
MLETLLHPADDREVVQELAFALRSRTTRGRRDNRDEAELTAERLVDYLHLSGFELMRRPQTSLDMSYVGPVSQPA